MEKPDLHTIVRYVVLQVPGFAAAVIAACLLLRYTGLPAWSIWTGLVLWVGKDILLFFWVWPSYCVPGAENDAMVGRTGYVVDWEGPDGTVKITGTLWRAAVVENEDPPAPGTRIRVCGRKGLTLFVRPEQYRRQPSP
jgi:membrane protein implicated in regulation of membrane protease activity